VENTPSAVDKTTLTLASISSTDEIPKILVPELKLSMDKIREAERRILDAKTVNPSTYAELESVFNESYRDIKRHLSSIGYQIAVTDKAMERAKADVLLDKYPTFLEQSDTKDNADLRKAFLIRDESYVKFLDRMNQLKAIESEWEGKIKVMENVCRYMRKQMDLLIRSGATNGYYVTGGKW